MSWTVKPKVLSTVPNIIATEYGKREAKRHIIRGRYEIANNLYKKDLYSHYGCVNAIEFSNNGQCLVSGGDDRRVLLWDVEKAISGIGKPSIMKGEHNSNIFCLGFNLNNTRLFSAGNDEQVIIHDAITGETLDVILHDEAIYGLSVDPINDNIFATACDDGRIFIWDLREPNLRDPLTLIRSQSAFHAVMHNPVEPQFLATANSKEGIGLWDIRKPKNCLLQYNGGIMSSQSAMSVRFNSRGTQILSLRRRLPPILYNVTSPHPIAEFDHTGYYNSCTMKSCCFAGDEDQYILSGSDDFKLYMWKIPPELFDQELSSPPINWVDKAHLILRGHRSIVNQVRFNYTNSIIASSGVEKIIKLWSVFPLPYGTGGIDVYSNKENRKVYSHEDYINLVLESGQFMTHDYSHQSVQEDPRMMAFFDSLVQRDIEGWTSDSSDDSISDSHSGVFGYFYASGRASSRSDESSLGSVSDSEDPLKIINPYTLSYINTLNARMESSSNLSLPSEPIENDDPSTSPKKKTNDTETSESNRMSNDISKITQLIHEKKKDQLRKVARNTLKTTRKRLKKIEKHCAKYQSNNSDDNFEEKPSTSRQASSSNTIDAMRQRLEEMNAVLEGLSRKVGIDGSNYENSKNRRSSQKLRRRLRYLTNQSDLILNEVLPDPDSDSDSDTSDLMNGEQFLDVVANGDQRMRHLLPTVSSCSDDEVMNNVKCETESSESDAQLSSVEVNVSVIEENGETNSHEEIGPESSSKNCNIESGLMLALPYLHSKCHPQSSSNCNDCEGEKPDTSVSFNKINHFKRCYRKRKLEDNDENNENKN
ncbi:DDB1- and CUL4-associated factor 5-like protein [Dinothrombium tinctorium]|uniref:DDB1-and CUL4-associated factor 5-like protein n=1 Tax=Dinothrombium tinctorium TaxID=1965070 RepID=A0A3S3RMT4_9ACAR|nr:DDB1- and CUL4-associated factor 5-like protein [Dinothrombium tinctorium]